MNDDGASSSSPMAIYLRPFLVARCGTGTYFPLSLPMMILRFAEVKKENEELYAMVDQREKEIAQLKEQLGQAERDYNSLKMARMLEVTDGDVEGAKKRVAGLIREVNRCITMLSEK
jgi:hypothetical protein